MKNLVHCVKCVIAIALGLFLTIHLLGLVLTGDAPCDLDHLWTLAQVSFIVAAMYVVPWFVYSWAESTKDKHEERVNDGSLSYRLSQVRYFIALAIIGLTAVLIALTLLFYGGRGGE
jgi:hypothetical protein